MVISMKKGFLTVIILIIVSGGGWSGKADKMLSEYYTDAGELARVQSCIRSSLFKEVSMFDDFTLKGERFLLLSPSTHSRVWFQSPRLSRFYSRLGNRKMFLGLLKNARAYGVEKYSSGGEKPAEYKKTYEARVLIMIHEKEDNPADAEFLVFLRE